MDIRKDPLVTGEVYHIFNKSIAGFKIFNNKAEFLHMLNVLRYYQIANPPHKFSRFSESMRAMIDPSNKLLEINAYCIMPTHLHLTLKQLKDKGISIYMSKIANSYARYFNTIHQRTGPLWVGKFKNVLIKTNDQFLHLTRYIHLNPTTSGLIENPIDWEFSSYKEYLGKVSKAEKICNFNGLIDIYPEEYKKFTEDQISYQRELKKIKDLILE